MAIRRQQKQDIYYQIKRQNWPVFWPRHSGKVKRDREMRWRVMTALSLKDHLSSCWECNTNDSVTRIGWRCMKSTQLCGSFIRPVNVILITSSISAHVSCTNAGNAKSFSLSLSHTHTHTLMSYSQTSLSPISISLKLLWWANVQEHTLTHTHTTGE